ncbi:MAG TPA: helix-turn-helix domain-containing protein, partial [Clostridia bacterium]|nr:helix-turn-helix domain-containing protein [Clostridia bacterium]
HGLDFKPGSKTQDYNDELIKDMLGVFSERKNKVAEILGIGRTTLWRILKTFQNEGQKTE